MNIVLPIYLKCFFYCTDVHQITIHFPVAGFPLQWGMGGVLPSCPKFLKIPQFCWMFPHQKLSLPTLLHAPHPSDHGPHIGKKVTLIAFRQILPKILPVACISRSIIIFYLKNLVGTKSVKGQLQS